MMHHSYWVFNANQSHTLGAHTHAHAHPCPWVLGRHGWDIIVHGWAQVVADECGLGMGTNLKEMLGSNANVWNK